MCFISMYSVLNTLSEYIYLFLKSSKALSVSLITQMYNLRILWRLLTILKASNKSAWNNIFWYVKVSIFWNCIQHTIHWDKTQMLKQLPSDKRNGTKNALFFLSRASTHYSFALNFWFSYKLKYKVCLSKTVCGIFHFWFCFVFIKVNILLNKMHGLFDFKTSLFLLKLK